jgi:hypothetical protein
MLSHPPYSPDLVLADFFFLIPRLRIVSKWTIQGCLVVLTDCDERTEGNTGRSVFSDINSLHERCKCCAEVGWDYTE